jgi:hypothetical protein
MLRIPGYRSRGFGLNSRRYEIFWKFLSLERGSLSLMSTIEELLERKSSGSADHPTPSIHKNWNWLRRQAAVCIFRSRTKATELVIATGIYRQHRNAPSFFWLCPSFLRKEVSVLVRTENASLGRWTRAARNPVLRIIIAALCSPLVAGEVEMLPSCSYSQRMEIRAQIPTWQL